MYQVASNATVDGVCAALKGKGFDVNVVSRMPTPNELSKLLKGQSQFWLTSRQDDIINESHVRIIKDFFEY